MDTPGTKNVAFKALVILHKGMLAGQLIFAVIAFYLVYSLLFNRGFHYPDRILQVTAIAFAGVGFYLGNFLFQRKVLKAKEIQPDAKKRFAMYQSACILQWVFIEGPCLFVIICFLLTGNYAFLVMAAALIIYFAMLGPSKMKIVLQLGLSEKEIEQL